MKLAFIATIVIGLGLFLASRIGSHAKIPIIAHESAQPSELGPLNAKLRHDKFEPRALTNKDELSSVPSHKESIFPTATPINLINKASNDSSGFSDAAFVQVESSVSQAKNEPLSDLQERMTVTIERWCEEKDAFYRNTLALNEEELQGLERENEAYSKFVVAAVDKLHNSPSSLSDDEFARQIKLISTDFDSKVEQIMGHQRFQAAQEFRTEFQEDMRPRFGIKFGINGF